MVIGVFYLWCIWRLGLVAFLWDLVLIIFALFPVQVVLPLSSEDLFSSGGDPEHHLQLECLTGMLVFPRILENFLAAWSRKTVSVCSFKGSHSGRHVLVLSFRTNTDLKLKRV